MMEPVSNPAFHTKVGSTRRAPYALVPAELRASLEEYVALLGEGRLRAS